VLCFFPQCQAALLRLLPKHTLVVHAHSHLPWCLIGAHCKALDSTVASANLRLAYTQLQHANNSYAHAALQTMTGMLILIPKTDHVPTTII
jgi:hypothetical protein